MNHKEEDQSRFRIRLDALAREVARDQNSTPGLRDVFEGSEQTDTQINAALRDMATGRYRQILEAIHRVDQGNYGICEGCSRPIDEERLEIIPETAYCVTCQHQREHQAESEFNGTKKDLDYI